MQGINFLWFATIIIIMMAWSPQGNYLSAVLATTALTLLLFLGWFQHKMRERSLFSPPRFTRGENRERLNGRAGRHISINNHGEPRMKNKRQRERVLEVGGELNQASTDMVQEAAMTLHRQVGCDLADTGYLGGMASLGSIMVTSMTFAKQPDDLREKFEREGQSAMAALISQEVMIFTALTAVYMQTNFNATTGALQTEFGPHIFYQALQAWEKLFPDKKADDYLNPRMLEAARKVPLKTDSVTSMDDFLAKRGKAFQPPKSLQ